MYIPVYVLNGIVLIYVASALLSCLSLVSPTLILTYGGEPESTFKTQNNGPV